MPHAIRIHAHGGPEVLRWEPVVAAQPGRGEVLIRQTANGLNFIDVYERTGLYPGALPAGLGREAALSMLREMLEIRAFEDKVYDLLGKNQIRGASHLYAGMEAVAVG